MLVITSEGTLKSKYWISIPHFTHDLQMTLKSVFFLFKVIVMTYNDLEAVRTFVRMFDSCYNYVDLT